MTAWLTAPFGVLLYLDRAGPSGLSGWIAPAADVDPEWITITCGGARLRAPLLRDRERIAGRALYRFECCLPFARANVMTLRLGGAAISLLSVHRGEGRAPFFAPVPFKAGETSALSRAHGRTLIVLAPIDWSFRRQRSQQLSAALSAHYEATLYLGPASLRLQGEAFPVDGGAVRLPLLGAAPDCDFALRALSEEEAQAAADALREEIGADGDVDVLVQFPSWQAVAKRLKGARIIYDCVDFHAALPNVCAPLAEIEAALVQNAGLCLATSAPLLEHVRALGAANAMLAPNAAPTPQMKAWPPRRDASVLYVGAVESWFDFALVEALARAMPKTTIAIIGACGAPPPAELPRNIMFLGERSHAHALEAMRRACVGVIPFKRDGLTAAVNPVKAYEYLAAGLPVVMTPMGGAELLDAPGVTIAKTPEAFVRAVTIAGGASDAERRRYAAWAAANTWEMRARRIVERLEDL